MAELIKHIDTHIEMDFLSGRFKLWWRTVSSGE